MSARAVGRISQPNEPMLAGDVILTYAVIPTVGVNLARRSQIREGHERLHVLQFDPR